MQIISHPHLHITWEHRGHKRLDSVPGSRQPQTLKTLGKRNIRQSSTLMLFIHLYVDDSLSSARNSFLCSRPLRPIVSCTSLLGYIQELTKIITFALPVLLPVLPVSSFLIWIIQLVYQSCGFHLLSCSPPPNPWPSYHHHLWTGSLASSLPHSNSSSTARNLSNGRMGPYHSLP